MDVTLLKYSIIEQLMQTDDEKLLQKVSKLIKAQPTAYAKPELKPMSVEELNVRIEQSRKDLEAGRVHTSEEVRTHFKNK